MTPSSKIGTHYSQNYSSIIYIGLMFSLGRSPYPGVDPFTLEEGREENVIAAFGFKIVFDIEAIMLYYNNTPCVQHHH